MRLDTCRNAKVHYARQAIDANQYVVRLEIAMDDACCMSMGDRVEHGMQNRNGFHGRQATACCQEFAKIFAGNILEDEIQIPLLFIRFKNGNDVGVAQLADHARFRKQLLVLLRIGARKMQCLDRDLSLQVRVARQIHNALCAPSQFTDYFKSPYLLAHDVRHFYGALILPASRRGGVKTSLCQENQIQTRRGAAPVSPQTQAD